MISNLLTSYWSLKRGPKEPYLLLQVILIIGNLVYGLVPNIWSMGIARFITGFGASTISTSRDYITIATLKRERPRFMYALGASRLIGVFSGPLVSLIFIGLDFESWSSSVTINQYTIPAFFLSGIAFILTILILFFFHEFKLSSSITKPLPYRSIQSNHFKPGSEIYQVEPEPESEDYIPNKRAIVLVSLLFFVIGTTFSLFVTLPPLFGYDNFGWGYIDDCIYFGISAAVCACFSLIVPLILTKVGFRLSSVFALILVSFSYFGNISLPGKVLSPSTFMGTSYGLFIIGYTLISSILFIISIQMIGIGENRVVVNILFTSRIFFSFLFC